MGKKSGGGPSKEQQELERLQISEIKELKRKEYMTRQAVARARRGRASLIRNRGGEMGQDPGQGFGNA